MDGWIVEYNVRICELLMQTFRLDNACWSTAHTAKEIYFLKRLPTILTHENSLKQLSKTQPCFKTMHNNLKLLKCLRESSPQEQHWVSTRCEALPAVRAGGRDTRGVIRLAGSVHVIGFLYGFIVSHIISNRNKWHFPGSAESNITLKWLKWCLMTLAEFTVNLFPTASKD